MCTAAVITTCY